MIPFPNKKYQIIYADPPWEQKKGGLRKCRPNQNRLLDYPVLSLEEIKEIFMLCPKSINHTIFVWTIDKFLFETEKLFNDYKLHARLIWDKCNGVAPAFTIRYTHEYLLWFYKSPMMKIDKNYRGFYTTVMREYSTKHSRKPEIAYQMIENLYPNTDKIELFARKKREGWDAWGNEV